MLTDMSILVSGPTRKYHDVQLGFSLEDHGGKLR